MNRAQRLQIDASRSRPSRDASATFGAMSASASAVSPRAALFADLSAAMGAAGDVEGARVVDGTIGRLLAAAHGPAADVIDLESERRKRER